MSTIFWKNLHLCFTTKLKSEHESSSIFPPSPTKLKDDTTTTTATAAAATSSSSSAATTSLQLLKNFNSLYELSSSASTSKSLFTPSTDGTDFMTSSDSDDVSDSDSVPPDFATVFASRRFFFSSPGRSNSIIESSSSLENRVPKAEYSSSSTEQSTVVPPASVDGGGGVAVKKYSPDPYRDFRLSMQEMIEARNLTHDDVKKDSEFLHELLLRYLTLNPKNTHKFIISAFADTVLCLLSSSSSPESDSNPRLGNHRR